MESKNVVHAFISLAKNAFLKSFVLSSLNSKEEKSNNRKTLYQEKNRLIYFFY